MSLCPCNPGSYINRIFSSTLLAIKQQPIPAAATCLSPGSQNSFSSSLSMYFLPGLSGWSLTPIKRVPMTPKSSLKWKTVAHGNFLSPWPIK